MRASRFLNFNSSDRDSDQSSLGENDRRPITEKDKGISEKIIDLFTDPCSPYIYAPENIKSLFSKQSTGKIKLEELAHDFQLKPTQVNFCTRYFDEGRSYYKCKQCRQDKYCYICDECWDQKKHIDHDWKRATSSSRYDYCDCGRKDRIKPTACSKHGEEKIEVQIPEGEKQKFLNYFLPLYKILFYLRDKKNELHRELNIKIHRTLEDLTEKSVYYCRLVSELFKHTVIYKMSSKVIFDIVGDILPTRKLFLNMSADAVAKTQLAKVYMRLEKSEGVKASNQLRSLDDLFGGEQILVGLAEEGYFLVQRIESYINFARGSKEGRQVFMKLIRCIETKKSKREFMKFIAGTVYEQRALIKEKEDQLFLLQKMIEHEEKEIHAGDFRKRHHIQCYILVIMSRLCKANVENFQKIDQIMEGEGYSSQRVWKLIEKLTKNIRSVIVVKDKQVSVGILMLLSLILKSKRMEELRDDLLSTLCGEGPLADCIDYSYRLFSLIAYADLFLEQARCEFITDLDELSCNNKKRAQMFRQYLYERRNIKKKKMWEMRESQKLNFPEAASTLIELCIFHPKTDSFVYTSPSQYPNALFKLNYNASFDTKQLLGLELSHKTQIRPSSSLQQCLFKQFFGGLNLLENMKSKWEETLVESQESAEKRQVFQSRDVGCMYLMWMTMIYKINGEKNHELQEELTKVKIDEGHRTKYTTIAKPNSIQEFLGIMDIPEEKKIVNNANSEEKENLKGEICFVCHEAEKVNDLMVYLAYIHKDQSICGIIYGDQSKSNTIITTCFHTVHANCFTEMEKKEGVQFNCPACKKQGYCIFPSSLEDKNLNRICQNVINVSMMIVWTLQFSILLFSIGIIFVERALLFFFKKRQKQGRIFEFWRPQQAQNLLKQKRNIFLSQICILLESQ